MLKSTLFLILSIFISQNLYTQSYWQQEVNYKIEVKLNDKAHTLSAFVEFEYINHSPTALNEIYIHLWPNAYADGKSALAEQQHNNDEQLLRFGNDSVRGCIDSLDFKVNGVKAQWEYDLKHLDICKITLATPLKSGESIRVSTPFKVKIPSGEISRLGHVGQSYQITQWYPKPAVYDKNGWHAIPYLNQGEFYSEFGSFDVSITVPKNYVVGATGDLQTESEIEFLTQLAVKTKESFQSDSDNSKVDRRKDDPFPLSSTEWKTIRYTQDRVHDFAWFADKRFEVLGGIVEMPESKRMVKSWAMFTPKNRAIWEDAIEYINDGTYYYSLWNGDYPYNSVTAVDGTISAGGGMEYPTITVIGNSGTKEQLEVVIVHEVGHNWFYGILGTNERDHGWMDEGMNTLNEVRYMQTKYPDNTAFSDMVLGGSFHFNDLSHFDLGDISYRAIAGLGFDQPIETKSPDFTSINYGVVMYQKTGLVFNYLSNYLGAEKFDQCMHTYFETWKFKHPQPEDMRKTLEDCSGKNLGWIFDDLIQTTNHVDYKMKKAKQLENGDYKVTVKNVGQVDGPIPVQAISGDSILSTIWVEPGQKKSTVVFPRSEQSITEFSIGRDESTPELNRQNNSWKAKGLLHKFEQPKMEFLIGDNEKNGSNAFWTPIIAGNYYDKFMIGASVHNYGIPFNKVQYLVAPMYSFGRKSVSGIAELSITTLPKNTLRMSKFGVSVKSFKNDTTYRNNDSYFFVASPYWYARLGNRAKNNSPFSNSIRLQTMYRADVLGGANTQNVGAFLEYNLEYNRPDHVFTAKVRNDYVSNIDNANSFGRSSLAVTYGYRYLKNKRKSWILLRAFVGGYWNSNFTTAAQPSYGMSIAGMNGTQDIFVEEYYFGRGLPSGIWSQQRSNNMGGFSSATNAGNTNQWMATTNLYVPIPLKVKIFGAFADLGFMPTGNSTTTFFNTGLAIKLGDIFGVYFPIYMSDVLENSFTTKNYAERIRFSLKMNVFVRELKLNGLF